MSQTYFGLHGPLGDRMFDLVSQQRKDQRLCFQDLVIAKVSEIYYAFFFIVLFMFIVRARLMLETKLNKTNPGILNTRDKLVFEIKLNKPILKL